MDRRRYEIRSIFLCFGGRFVFGAVVLCVGGGRGIETGRMRMMLAAGRFRRVAHVGSVKLPIVKSFLNLFRRVLSRCLSVSGSMEAEQVADSWGRGDDGLSEPARLWEPSRWIESCLLLPGAPDFRVFGAVLSP